jgi:hypothetical protein
MTQSAMKGPMIAPIHRNSTGSRDGVQQHGEKNDERPKTGCKQIGGCHIESLKGLTKKSLKATVQIAA